MSDTPQTIPSPSDVARLLVTHRKRWLVPAAVVAAVVAVYAVVRPATWEASQTLIIRNEAANNELGPGKFGHSDEMKNIQQTLMELARSRGVLAAALETVGPPAGYRAAEESWPREKDVERLRRKVRVTPPNGAEFGRTEVFYLKVKDHDPDRAVALNRAICDVLSERFQEIRDVKAKSMIAELEKAANLARADLEESTARLAAIERETGSDLSELRALVDGGNSDGALPRTVTEIRSELRQIGATGDTNRELLDLLREARHDPGQLVATPGQLLESQPALKRLKDGLVDAQLRTAELKGRLSDAHPLVRAAKLAEENVAGHLHEELAVAIRGLELELRLSSQREQMLTERLDDATGRLGHLAGLRATYANRLAETAHRTELLKRAEENLAEARAAHASAKASSLIDRIDDAETGTHPVGPGRGIIALAGLLGGLLVGFGVLFLSVPSAQPASPAPSANGHAIETPVLDRPAAKPNGHARPPVGNLTFKEALHKLASTRV